jgi:homoserine kinase
MVDRSEQRKQELELFLTETMQENGISARTLWLPPCTTGVTAELLERNGMQNESFLDMIKGELQP